MTARVLFVCAQNVCRSPLMAASFAAAVGDPQPDGGGRGWVVHSAGTHAHDGRAVCPFVAGLESRARLHRSAKVSAEDIDMADLVITASREERAWIAQQAPESRAITFTLREALLLDDRLSEESRAGTVDDYVAALNGHRGTIDMREPSASRWRRVPEHPLDLEDVHGTRRRRHLRGLSRVSADAADLGKRMRESLRAGV